jgi:hypothetical protein
MRLLLVLTAVAIAVPSLPAQPEKGKPFHSPNGRYTADFPSRPREEVQKLTIGKEEVHVHSAAVDGKGFAFLVMWNDMPEAALNPPAKTILDGAVKGATNKGTVTEDKELTFGPGKLPARQIVLDTKEGVRFRILIILKDRRLYQVMAGGTKEFAASPKAEAFLKSFELTK